MIIKTLEVGLYAANCYIVGSEKTGEGIIIDPGEESRRILNLINDLNWKIGHIVLTHTHRDHLGAVKEVMQATGAVLAVHMDEAQPFLPKDSTGSPSKAVIRVLKDGDVVTAGDLQFKVLHTPGHSPGGICLFGHGVVFTGDTLFNYSIGRSDFPGGSHRQLIQSIQTKLLVLPDETTAYPGHGPASTIGNERRGNPFLRGSF